VQLPCRVPPSGQRVVYLSFAGLGASRSGTSEVSEPRSFVSSPGVRAAYGLPSGEAECRATRPRWTVDRAVPAAHSPTALSRPPRSRSPTQRRTPRRVAGRCWPACASASHTQEVRPNVDPVCVRGQRWRAPMTAGWIGVSVMRQYLRAVPFDVPFGWNGKYSMDALPCACAVGCCCAVNTGRLLGVCCCSGSRPGCQASQRDRSRGARGRCCQHARDARRRDRGRSGAAASASLGRTVTRPATSKHAGQQQPTGGEHCSEQAGAACARLPCGG
jgi:hypothetical protein